MKDLVVYGVSNPVVVKLIEAINRSKKAFNFKGFLLREGDAGIVSDVLGYPVLGTDKIIPDILAKDPETCFFNNINFSVSEIKEADEVLAKYDCSLVSLIHPDIDMNHVVYGENCMLCDSTTVGPDTTIGKHLTCRGAFISHEVAIGDYVYISPCATVCGTTVLGDGCDLGAGCTILPRVKIGKNTIVGAGAVVTKDLPDNVTAVGVPAKIIKHH